MKEFLNILIAIALLLIQPSHAASKASTARLDQIVQSYVDDKLFTGSVLVARDGKILLNKGYGEANREWAIPNRPESAFRIASVTKQFTAAAILLLAERGKLSIHDRVSSHMPDAPAAWKDITIFHLLTHSSGIPDFTRFPDFGDIQAVPTTPAKLIASFRDKALDFIPGERAEYSSSGYILLGHLIEKISGHTYDRFLRETIFMPLSMRDSGVDRSAKVLARRASGYTMTEAGIEHAQYVDMSLP